MTDEKRPIEYLKIDIRVGEGLTFNDAMIYSNQKIYPIDHISDETYRTFLTYEILEMIDELRTWMKTK